MTAAYDVDGAPDALGYPTGDGDLSNNPREVFASDDKWQLVAVFNQGPVDTGTGARPPPVLKERYVYHAAGMRGLSLSQGLDRVVKRERFSAPDGNGVQILSDEVYYLQNRRGDVTELLGPDGEVKERVRYTVYGEAEAIDPGFDALDIDGNGSVDPDDLAQFIAWFFAENPTESGAFQRDFNHDGEFTPDDLADFMGDFFAWDPNNAPAQARPTLAMDHGALSRPGIENRLGYCGYV